jgi:hypothetical protein
MRLSKKVLVRAVAVLAIVYGGFVGAMWWAMHQPPETFGRVMAHMPVPAVFLLVPFETMWVKARAGRLQPGDPAPDFSLMTLDKAGRVQLSSMISKQPVVLVFGSYT